MNNSLIRTVWFEGEHNSGKWSQISLLRELLDNLNIPSCVVRGALYRPGIGKCDYQWMMDPENSYRKNIMQEYNSIENMTTEEKIAFELQNADRLNRELIVFLERYVPNYLKSHTPEQYRVIFDRTLLSSYYRFKRYNYTPDLSAHKIPIETTFFLDVAQETLLQRNTDRNERNPSLHRARENNIAHNYGLWQQVMAEHPEKRIITLDGNKKKEELFEEIKNSLQI